MFSEMIATIKNGQTPDITTLQGRLRAAIVKKMAILQLARQFRHNDNKINPKAQHILWAAIIANDPESIATALDIILFEETEQEKEPAPVATIQQQEAQQLLNLIPKKPDTINLRQQITKLTKDKQTK